MRFRLPAALLLCFVAGHAMAVEPQDQYKAYLTKAQSIEPITEFGDQISLRDGHLSFKVMDVEVPGTGPTIRIVRTASLDDGLVNAATSGNNIGGWEIEIPRLKTITADPLPRPSGLTSTSPRGWQVAAEDKNARCTAYAPPGTVAYNTFAAVFPTSDWWFGYQLVDASGDEHPLITRRPELPRPEYKIGTSDNWIVGCLANTANGLPGEAFLAIAPDGTKYWFDYLVYTNYEMLSLEFPDLDGKGPGGWDLPRRAASMLVTKIEDRFGNSVQYTYSTTGKVTSITGSDGRVVSFAYDAGGISVTVGSGATTRVWRYTNDVATGTFRVTLPDGSAWSYVGNFNSQFFSTYEFTGCSQNYIERLMDSRQVSVTAPSGAVAAFSLDRRMMGRSFVPKACSEYNQINPDAGYSLVPRRWVGYAMTSKIISGFGMATQSWQYSYSPNNASWKADCDAGASCPDTVWTDVVGPGGERTRSYFSNRWDQTENKLVKEERYGADAALLQTVQYTYATTPSNGPNPYAWPLKVGYLSNYGANEEVNLRWTPLVQKTITQQGRVFDWKVDATCTGASVWCFDAFARPTKVIKESRPAP